MNGWQIVFVSLFGLVNIVIFFVGYHQSKSRKNSLGITYALNPLGIYVYGDAVIFGMFWFLTAMVTLFLKDWILFLLVFSVFWVVRSLGETIYFFNQQFSKIVHHSPKNFLYYNISKDDYTTWFMIQISQQCITVVSIIASVYLFNLWLR